MLKTSHADKLTQPLLDPQINEGAQNKLEVIQRRFLFLDNESLYKSFGGQ